MNEKEMKEKFKEGCEKVNGEFVEEDVKIVCKTEDAELGLLRGKLFPSEDEDFQRAAVVSEKTKGSVTGVDSIKFTPRDESLTVWGDGEDHVKLSKGDLMEVK